MLKRIVSLLLIFAIALSFCSCDYKGAAVSFYDAVSRFLDAAGIEIPDHECVFEDDGDADFIKLVKCSDSGCEKYGRPSAKSEFADVFADYLDLEDEKKEITDFCASLLFELNKAGKYESKEAPDDGIKERFEKLEEYGNMAKDVYDVASLYYYGDIIKYGDKYREAKELYDSFREMLSKIDIAAYDSVYRYVYFCEEDGWDDELIEEEINFAKLVVEDEFAVLLEKIEDVTYKIYETDDSSEELPVLYAELIEANNNFASFMGYDNFYEYAMENEYGRDYTADDARAARELCKEYIAPLMWEFYDNRASHSASALSDKAYSAENGSFTSDPDACNALYSFYKRVSSLQDDAPTTYYDAANDALSSGNITISDSDNAFETAYTSYLEGLEVSVMYFCASLCDADTFVHEFGHYYSCVTGTFSGVSLDINEMQSQGAQFLYLSYLKEYFEDNGIDGYTDIEFKTLMTKLLLTVYAIADDEFEEALYSGNFDGIYDPDGLFEDGVTSDEYDYLYACILDGYGFETGDKYWRGSVTVSPCYYLSYAVAYINCFEIYASSVEDGFDSAAKKYLELFEFPGDDGFDERDISDVEFYSEKAEIASPFDESAYIGIYRALSDMIG